MLWQVKVIETLQSECLYFIEADSVEEAEELAQNGETEFSHDIKLHGVIARHLLERPVQCQKLSDSK